MTKESFPYNFAAAHTIFYIFHTLYYLARFKRQGKRLHAFDKFETQGAQDKCKELWSYLNMERKRNVGVRIKEEAKGNYRDEENNE